MKVLVTGGRGFLGSWVMEELGRYGHRGTAVTTGEYDLRDARDVRAATRRYRPDAIIHLAARVGGIGANRAHPGSFFYDNMLMGLNVIERARKEDIKVVVVGTACSYPNDAPVPLSEDALWDGFPAAATAPYAIAKKSLQVMLEAYAEEYGLRSAFVIPTNLYGPRDNFDPETSHVIPALIRKVAEAKAAGSSTVELWGTGTATRDFLYAGDAARGIVLALDLVDDPFPINLGSGEETPISVALAEIASCYSWSGYPVWKTSKPDGTPRRVLDVARAWTTLGWAAQTGLRLGLAHTIDWWETTL